MPQQAFGFVRTRVATFGSIVVICLSVVATQSRRGGAASETAAPSESYSKAIRPFVAQYCGDCHSGAAAESKLDLTKYADFTGVLRDRKIWRKVLFKLEGGEMPPADEPQPRPDQIASVVRLVDARLAQPVPAAEQDSGRMTIRRLNRAEYNNTIRDLMAIDFHPADDFPSDDVGEGFDNIGAVLSLSPILLEKYLAAAEQCVDRALTILPESPPPTKAMRASRLEIDGEITEMHRGTVWLSSGKLFYDWDVPKTGKYNIGIRAFAAAEKDAPVGMSLKLDRKGIECYQVKPGEISTARLYERGVTIDSGTHRIEIAFAGKRHDQLAVVNVELEGPLRERANVPEAYRRIVVCQPKGPADRAECARKVIRRFADRAFRRPVKPDELDGLMTLWRKADAKSSGPFDRSLALPLEAVLVSPQFLFRVENDPAVNLKRPHPINDYELASRLSYFLWSSMPDDQLFDLARRDELHKPATLETEIRRMIADRKSRALVDNFAGQWLQFRRLGTMSPDTSKFPAFDDSLRGAMRKETELYFSHIMGGDRSVLEFLDSDYTFLNDRLARFYGIAGVDGDEFRKATVGAAHRGGLLTQSSILLVTSNPGRTSPVKRGKWILENLLAAAPPPPPANVPALKDDQKTALHGTLRQRMEQHRANALCASCHKTMDALGFGLENFDAIGAWRTRDGGLKIDASGTLPGGRAFSGVDDLRKILLTRRDQFCHCLVEKMLTYALGRGLEDYDAAAVDEISYDAAKNDYRFSSIVLGIARSVPFQMRRGKEQH
jgi:hypothetical protein